MKTKQLGHTDMHVTELCLGSMTWGEQNTQADADAQLDRAVDYGINFIDTAEMYSIPVKAETYGSTETIIGNWLQKSGQRQNVILASKVAGKSERLTWIRDGKNQLNRANMMEALEGSLKRLQTDYIDLYQLHWPDRNTNNFGQLGYQHQENEEAVEIHETLQVCKEMVDSGKVRAIGLSNETPWGAMTFLRLAEQYDLPRVVSIQNPYNLINRTYEVGLAEVSIREHVGLMCYGILASGALSGKYLNGQRPAGARITQWPEYFSRYISSGSQQAIAQYVELANQIGITPSQLALAWGLRQPFMLSVILGATKLEQLEDQLAATQIKLSDDTIDQIEAIHNASPNPYLIA